MCTLSDVPTLRGSWEIKAIDTRTEVGGSKTIIRFVLGNS